MEYTLKLTGEEVNMIGLALQKQPYDMVTKIIANLQKQVNEQNTPKEEVIRE